MIIDVGDLLVLKDPNGTNKDFSLGYVLSQKDKDTYVIYWIKKNYMYTTKPPGAGNWIERDYNIIKVKK